VPRLEGLHRRLVEEGPSSIFEKGLFALLIPLSLLYGALMWLRSGLYRTGLLPTVRSETPVISVGNLAVGGTGKTPFVDYLLDYFEAKNLRPAVVSRGYGGSFAGKLAVVCDGSGPVLDADCCGDEPYLLARKHPRALVMIAPRRGDAISWINARKNADVIILDDAFQHLQVGRDLDIVLLDAAKPFANGYPLPAGALREFPHALQRADLLLLTRAEATGQPRFAQRLPQVRCRHRISDQLEALDGRKLTMHDLAAQRGVAFAGIARPDTFFQALAAAGLELVATCPLPDHENYAAETLSRLSNIERDIDYFITTEKDAVKINPEDFPKPCYFVRLKISMFDDRLLRKSLDSLSDRIRNADK
jgi:tetraacyldisaccharide 4'-kinase